MMALVPKIDPNKIFASNAPTQDKPAAFDNYEKGMDETRKNNGRPTIPQLNYLHQTADQKVLWIHQNGGGLPYDPSIEYTENAVTLKDGELKQLVDGTWIEVKPKSLPATAITTASAQNQQEINDFGGAKWYAKVGGYKLGATVKLDNGDIVKSTIPNNTNNPNADRTGWAFFNCLEVESIAHMLAINSPNDGQRVYVKSYYASRNSGGGYFAYDAAKASTNDLGLVINGWLRQDVLTVTPEMFGAKGGDKLFDDHPALQAAFISGHPVQLRNAFYYTSKPLYHRSNFTLDGNGYFGKSQIFKLTTTVSDLADVVSPDGVTPVSYAKDAVLIAYPESGDYVHDVSVEGVLLGKVYDGVVGDGYFMKGIVYYAPYIAQSMFKRMQLNACQYSFYIVSQWMCSFERVEGACHGGWVTGGLTGDSHRICTTSSYTACWSKNVFGSGAVAWSFYDTKSTTMRSCGTDGLGSDGAPASACIRAEQSDITINGFGLEVAYTGAWIEAIDSVINASGLFCYQYANYVANGSLIFRSIRSQVKLELSKLDFVNKTIGATLPVFVLAEDNSFFELDNVRSDPPIQGMNTGTGWDVRALSGSHIIIDADGTRSEYDHGSTSLQFPSNGGRNVTNRAIQSENITQDFGLTATLGGRIGNNYMRLGLARLFTNTSGRVRYTVNNVPSGDFDGYRIGGIDVHTNDTTAAALDGNMYYNSTTGRLRLFDGSAWVEFSRL